MARPHPALRRFELDVYRRYDDDHPLVPASAWVDFYQQGATVNQASIQIAHNASQPLVVFHPGVLPLGMPPAADPIKVIVDGWDGSPVVDDGSVTHNYRLTVTNVTRIGSVFTITARNDEGDDPVVVQPYSRLILLTRRATVSSDPMGTVPVTMPLTTVEFEGRAQAYVRDYRYDFVVRLFSDENLMFPPPRVHIDAEGSFIMRT